MNSRKWIVFAAVGLILLMTASVALANDVSGIDWWVIAGGGAPSSRSNISMNGTLGQPVLGLSDGGAVKLSAGYWAGIAGYTLYLPIVLR